MRHGRCGEINEVAVDVNRLEFMRWLVAHRKVSDWAEQPQPSL
ncbi:MAG TPA: hypothetical protein VK009_21810 [Chloroflexota bacterium]|nr:hypothetical protein [Chloroflexota bacterium]